MFHAAGQAIKTVRVFLGGGESQEKADEEDAVDLDLDASEEGSEESGSDHYLSPAAREAVKRVLASDDGPSPDSLTRQPNYRSGDIVELARPSPAASKLSNMTRPHRGVGKKLGGFTPHNTIDDPINKIEFRVGSLSNGTSRTRRPAKYIGPQASKESHHSSTSTSSFSQTMIASEERPSKKRKISTDGMPNLDLEMTGVETVQQPSRAERSADGSLENQKDHMRQLSKGQKTKFRKTNEDEDMGDGFDAGVNVDENDDVKPVMTQNGLSPPIRSQTISGDLNDSQRATTSKAVKSRPRDRGGTLRSISDILSGNQPSGAGTDEVRPALPSRHKKEVVSESGQSEAGQPVDQPAESDEENGDMMNSSGRKSIALLRSFCDVHGNNLGEQGMYIYMNRIKAQFEVQGQSGLKPVAVHFSVLLRYTEDSAGNGVACILEGSQVHVNATDTMQAYWAGLTFKSHDGLCAFKNAIANIRGGIKLIPKPEDKIQATIKNKKSAQDKNIKEKKLVQDAWAAKLAREQNTATSRSSKKGNLRSVRSMARSPTGPSADEPEVQQSAAKFTHQPNTPKLRDRMHGDGDEIPTTTTKELRSADSSRTPTNNEFSTRPRRTRAEDLTPQEDSERDSSATPARATRSSGRTTTKQTIAQQPQAMQESYRTPFEDTEHAACPWKSALLYPSKGPGRATVEFEDLQRLDDEAYLNDNLISFGLRYLQEKYPASKSKVYIFNSFFYNTLAGKGRKDIDYDAVKRWTSKIDLFSYDHVVVPINAGMHWYWAIICNIRNVFADAESDEKQDAMVDEQAEKLDELSITTEHEEAAPRASRKNDPTIPTIVTLDSLHNPHSPVVGNLKKYVIQEAQNKKGKEVDQSFIKTKGMTSREIPSQQNLTDCGLHLIITIGELLKSPDEFVAKLIAKSFDNEKDFAGWEYMSEYREYWKKNVLDEYNTQTGGEYYKEVAKAKAKKDHAQKLKEVQASKANPPYKVPKTSGPLLPSTNTTTSAPTTRQRSASPSKPASTKASIHTPYKTPMKPQQPIQLAKVPLQDLSSESEEDVRSSPPRTSTTEMQWTRSPPPSSHVTDKLRETLESKEIKADANILDFVADSQPSRDEDHDELEIIDQDAHQKEIARRHDSRSPAKQVNGNHTDLGEQGENDRASFKVSQTPTPPRTAKKLRKSTPHHSQIINLDDSQDAGQSVSIDDTLNNLVESLKPYHATETTSRLSRANDIFSQDLPFGSSQNLHVPNTQDTDELDGQQRASTSDLLGATNGDVVKEVMEIADDEPGVVDVEKIARAAEARRHKTQTKKLEKEGQRGFSPGWPGLNASPRAPAPRAPSPEL